MWLIVLVEFILTGYPRSVRVCRNFFRSHHLNQVPLVERYTLDSHSKVLVQLSLWGTFL